MYRIRFRNGVDAVEILLEEEFETEREAKLALPELAHRFGTVPDAAAWIDGEKPPRHLAPPKVKAEPEPEPEPEPDEEEPEPGTGEEPDAEPTLEERIDAVTTHVDANEIGTELGLAFEEKTPNIDAKKEALHEAAKAAAEPPAELAE